LYDFCHVFRAGEKVMCSSKWWRWNIFLLGPLEKFWCLCNGAVFCPTNYRRRWASMEKICSIEPLLTREEWDKLSHFSRDKVYALSCFFCCIAEKKITMGHARCVFFYTRVQWSMLYSKKKNKKKTV